MQLTSLLQASGLWNDPVQHSSLRVVQAFYDRPWAGDCSIEDVVTYAASRNVDPLPLMKMLVAVEELEVSFDLSKYD